MQKNSKRKDGAQRQRAKGKGSIIKRGGIYHGRWVVGGKIYTRSLKTSNRREAEERLADMLKPYVLRDEEASLANAVTRLGGIRAEIEEYEDRKPALSFSDAFGVFRGKAGRTSVATMSMYESQFRRLCDWMRHNAPETKELRQLDRETAQRFLDYIEGGFSGNTYNKYLALMRLIWRKCAKEIRAKQDPWADFERREQAAGSGRRALTTQELAAVCALLEGEMRILFALGIYTGLRLGDCALLKWDSIDLARGLMHVLPRKTAKTRRVVTVSIHPTLAALLKDAPRTDGSPYVLPETAAQYMRDDSSLAVRIQALFEKAGIRTQGETPGYSRKVTLVGFHSLRHTFVSLCGNGGMSLAYVQSIVGHANPMMTSHYFHADAEAHRKQLDAALPDVLAVPNNEHPGDKSGDNSGEAQGGVTLDEVFSLAAKLPVDERKALIDRLQRLG